MLIALYFFMTNVAMPQIGAYAQALLEPTMVIVITLAGIIMLFGAIGMKISNNLGSTVIGGIFQGIGYLCRTVFHALGWIIRNTFKMIPRVFNGSKVTFNQAGLNIILSNIIAGLITIAFIAVII